MTTTGWILLLIFGCPIIVLFWVFVAIIIALVCDNKSSDKGIAPIGNKPLISSAKRSSKRCVKPRIIKLLNV